MAEVFFDNPPALQGKEDNKIQQLYLYLNAMSEKLNTALMDVTIEQMAPETKQVITGQAEVSQQHYDSLKSMIVKTAQVVRHEMDEIRVHLEDNYTALSDQFGEYQRNLTSEITATANGILQDYQFQERITGLENDTESFMRQVNQYIFFGLINENPVRYGIAIGENVTKYDEHGNPSINDNQKTATFTMDELAFWQGTTKLAWFASRVMHIDSAEIENTLKFGNHTWKIMTDGAMGLVSG